MNDRPSEERALLGTHLLISHTNKVASFGSIWVGILPPELEPFSTVY